MNGAPPSTTPSSDDTPDASSAGEIDTAARRVLLANRDYPCPGCGYNLRNLTAAHCPECEQELRVELRLADAGLRPYLLAIGGLVAATASGGLLFILVCIGSVLYGDPAPPGYFVLGVVPALIGAAGLRGLVRAPGRRAFQLASPERRALIIAGSWLPFAGLFLAFVMLIIVDP